ncbi:zinc-dependent metalloprotease [Nesterenkonia sp. MY13]|uniref:Zinc-dependent metalloprotease n=1 Tax=Nesterenkonia sedimenti TaxID=1463632 RepID=A0A7X8TIU4_9MICC|nr:zinc-dependent metalloprotease [Nesterenkonia sedimenti]NLS09270.1 zinc-dependent metalloprotease [Nesterenkonia sedimenti]
MTDKSDGHSGEDRGGNEEEFLRKLFGEAFGEKSEPGGEDDKNDDADNQGSTNRGPSMGFTGNPGAGSSGDQGQAGGFPGFPPGFDPSQFDPSQLGAFGADPAMMQQIMGQVQAMFSAMQNQDGEETINWDLAKNAAVSAIGSDDASVTPAESKQIDDALRLAEMWLNDATSFEAVGAIGQGYSRRQWIEQTFESWKRLTTPVAESVGRAMAQVVRQQLEDGDGAHIPEELKGMLPPDAAGQMASMMERMGSMAFGTQIGQAIGQLAAEVHSASDIGLPLAGDTMALIPANIKAFGEGLQVEDEEILLYLALREAARMRLFIRAPWLQDDLFNAVAQYAAGIHINMERIEEAASQIDPSNPQEMEDLFGDGLFQTDRTPMQEAALRRIETTLALVEGWVDDVVAQAGSHLPSLEKLRETMNRRRASGGPAEATFAALVGLELRPRRLRDAAALWAHLRETDGAAGRDEVWSHPDVQPDEADLDDPQGFHRRREERQQEAANIDEELKKLLDGGYEGPGSDGPTGGQNS